MRIKYFIILLTLQLYLTNAAFEFKVNSTNTKTGQTTDQTFYLLFQN